jgi:hypothetical protein
MTALSRLRSRNELARLVSISPLGAQARDVLDQRYR